MPKYIIEMQVPATWYGAVEIEADSIEEAYQKYRIADFVGDEGTTEVEWLEFCSLDEFIEAVEVDLGL